MAAVGIHDFTQALIEYPSPITGFPRGGEPPVVVCVGEGAPPVDLAHYAGKTLYVHRIRPGARERYAAAMAELRAAAREAPAG